MNESTDIEHDLNEINGKNASLENQEIYVNPLGCDDANGSFQNPVSSIHRAGRQIGRASCRERV